MYECILISMVGTERHLCSMRFIDDFDDDDAIVDDTVPIILLQNDYVDQFRYTHHVSMKGLIRDASLISISTHCTRLKSLDVRSLSKLKDAMSKLINAMDVLLHEMYRTNGLVIKTYHNRP
jgi:hypothetical protein